MYEIAKLEFSRWLEKTDITTLSSYEKTMIGIIIDHFDEIASCGTANGARAKLIGKYIVELGNKAERETLTSFQAQLDWKKVKRLKSLSVERFRGFGTREEFDFSTQYTFYHGPNGSGKTSFCEALEYSVLGAVAEASSRGISLEKYVAHAGEKHFSTPTLICELDDGQSEQFVPNLSAYRFAFMEKNRILDFSHIGATTAKNQTERIAALFGLTEFQAFVHEFTDSFDKRYITLESDLPQKYETKKSELQSKTEQLNNLGQDIKSKKDALKELIASLGRADLTTSDQAIEYMTNPETGIISIAARRASEHHIEFIDEDELQTLKRHIEGFIAEINEISKNNTLILADLESVNLSMLFNAVIALEDTFTEEVCPVCRTPLVATAQNPFQYAKEELEKFRIIETAKKNVKTSSKKVAISIQGIISELSKSSVVPLFANCDLEAIFSATVQASDYETMDYEAIGPLVGCVKKVQSILLHESLHSYIETYNSNAKSANKKYDDKVQELQKTYGDISGLVSTISELEKQSKASSDSITLLSAEVQKLKESSEAVESQIAFNKEMVAAYESVRRRIAFYVAKLPAELAANLSEKVREYYNYINRGDADFELIESLKLPVSANEKILVKMYDGLNQDALQILSEGHVRILGLSILLAKAISEDMPFIVFDDIVNSIDDDHRDGVASLLITHPDFENMQMILTCHGELFVSSLESYVENRKKMTRYMFLPADSLEERGIVIKYQDSTIPLKIAREKYQNGELKDSAAKCRQAVECISGALWKKISPCVGGISIKLRNLQGSPDLRSVVDGLKAATNSKNMDGVETLHELLEKLTGMRVWNLLNKGTHVDVTLPEFSRVEIKELLDLLDCLNNEVKALKVKPAAV